MIRLLCRGYFGLVICCLGIIPSIIQGVDCMVLERKTCADFRRDIDTLAKRRAQQRFKVRCDGKEGWVSGNIQIKSVTLLYSDRRKVRQEELLIPRGGRGSMGTQDFLHSLYDEMRDPSLNESVINRLLGRERRFSSLPNKYRPKSGEIITIRPDSLDISDNTKLYHDCHLKNEKGTIANMEAEEGELNSGLICNYIRSRRASMNPNFGGSYMSNSSPVMIRGESIDPNLPVNAPGGRMLKKTGMLWGCSMLL